MIADLEPPFVLIKPAVSEEEFYALEGEDSDWEFLDGRLVMSPASNRHENLFRFLLMILSGFLDERGGGAVRGSRYPMRLDERWSPEPDLMVVREENLGRMGEQRLEGPADLVIEIVSAGDLRFEEREKLPRYRQARIPEIWLIDPYAESIRVETLTTRGYQTTTLRDGRLASTIVPGFWIEVGWLWREPLPSSFACLREILG
jgi:Uma2 family endonuclease